MKRRHRTVDQPILDLATHPARYVTVVVLAEYLEVGCKTVTRMIHRGDLTAFKAGREWRIPLGVAQQRFAAWREPGAGPDTEETEAAE